MTMFGYVYNQSLVECSPTKINLLIIITHYIIPGIYIVDTLVIVIFNPMYLI